MNKHRTCVKRLAVKRQLRRRGIEIPRELMLDLGALRKLRAQS